MNLVLIGSPNQNLREVSLDSGHPCWRGQPSGSFVRNSAIGIAPMAEHTFFCGVDPPGKRPMNSHVLCAHGAGRNIALDPLKLSRRLTATIPSRLLDLIDQRALTLRNVEILVLDDAYQLMDLGWKWMIPLALVNIVVTGIVVLSLQSMGI